MAQDDLRPILIEQAMERLRQERETFDHRRRQDNSWFRLRLTIGYVAAIILTVIAAACIGVIFSGRFSDSNVTAAISVLSVDVLGLIGSIIRVAMNPESATQLQPVTSRVPFADDPQTTPGTAASPHP